MGKNKNATDEFIDVNITKYNHHNVVFKIMENIKKYTTKEIRLTSIQVIIINDKYNSGV
jgi:hypothetical protein